MPQLFCIASMAALPIREQESDGNAYQAAKDHILSFLFLHEDLFLKFLQAFFLSKWSCLIQPNSQFIVPWKAQNRRNCPPYLFMCHICHDKV